MRDLQAKENIDEVMSDDINESFNKLLSHLSHRNEGMNYQNVEICSSMNVDNK